MSVQRRACWEMDQLVMGGLEEVPGLAYSSVGAPLSYTLDVAPVSLPGAFVLFLSGLGLLGLRQRAA